MSNGLGSFNFAILWDGKELHGLDASGMAPAAWSPAYFRSRHGGAMSVRGWDSVTTPGAVAGWVALSKRFKAGKDLVYRCAKHHSEPGSDKRGATAAHAQASLLWGAGTEFTAALYRDGAGCVGAKGLRVKWQVGMERSGRG